MDKVTHDMVVGQLKAASTPAVDKARFNLP